MTKLNRINFGNTKFTIVSIFLLSIYSFFGYLFPNDISYSILTSSLIIILFSIAFKKKQLVISKQLNIILLITLFIFIQLLSVIFSVAPSNSLKVFVNRSVILIIGILFCLETNWYKSGIKILFVFSFIHMFFTILLYLFPTIFSNFLSQKLPSETSIYITSAMSRGLYPGITNQVARNAFYISVGIAVLCNELIKDKHNRNKYIIMCVFLLALLLTGKRGHLVSNFIAILLTSIVYTKYKNKKIFTTVIRAVVIILLIFIVLTIIFPEAATPIMRFIERKGRDQSSGRIQLYILALDLFYQRPIMGWGIGTYNYLFGTGTHNMYLQVLSENGVIGLVCLLLVLFANILNGIKSIKFSLFKEGTVDNKYLIFSLYIQFFYIMYALTGNPLNDGFILIIYLLASSIPYTIKLKKVKLISREESDNENFLNLVKEY